MDSCFWRNSLYAGIINRTAVPIVNSAKGIFRGLGIILYNSHYTRFRGRRGTGLSNEGSTRILLVFLLCLSMSLDCRFRLQPRFFCFVSLEAGDEARRVTRLCPGLLLFTEWSSSFWDCFGGTTNPTSSWCAHVDALSLRFQTFELLLCNVF